eukprot:403375021
MIVVDQLMKDTKENKIFTNNPRSLHIPFDLDKYYCEEPLRIAYFDSQSIFESCQSVKRAILTCYGHLTSLGYEITKIQQDLPHFTRIFELSMKLYINCHFLQNKQLREEEMTSQIKSLISKIDHRFNLQQMTQLVTILKSSKREQQMRRVLQRMRTAKDIQDCISELLLLKQDAQLKLQQMYNCDIFLCPVYPLVAPLKDDYLHELLPANAYAIYWNILEMPNGIIAQGLVNHDETDYRSSTNDIFDYYAKQVMKYSAGMPISVQIVGQQNQDETVLRNQVVSNTSYEDIQSQSSVSNISPDLKSDNQSLKSLEDKMQNFNIQQNSKKRIEETNQNRINGNQKLSQNGSQSFFDMENIYPQCKSIEISEELEEFYQIKKNYMIFTEAGKPVYTRFGDEMVMAPFFATMSAIIPKLQSYYWNNLQNAKEQSNKLRWIETSQFCVAIVKKGNFYYICISNNRPAKYLDDDTTKKPLKYLRFVSLMTSSVNDQLTKRPSLDIKTSIAGLERTLDMMCEISVKSPSIFLEAYQPLRMPENARKAVEKAIEANKPSNFACGMLVSALNVICTFSDPTQIDEVKAHDITVILNYIYANPSMKNVENWTPICIPGIAEEHILYVYVNYDTPNVGIIIICTDHSGETFFECQKASASIFSEIKERGLIEIIDKCTIQMYEWFDMKEIQMVLIRNNILNQYTTYNYPLLTKVTELHLQALRIFERLWSNYEAVSLSQNRRGPYEIKEVRDDFTYALICQGAQGKQDYSLFICYNHRKNNDLVKISKFLMDDIKQEEKNCFIQRLI